VAVASFPATLSLVIPLQCSHIHVTYCPIKQVRWVQLSGDVVFVTRFKLLMHPCAEEASKASMRIGVRVRRLVGWCSVPHVRLLEQQRRAEFGGQSARERLTRSGSAAGEWIGRRRSSRATAPGHAEALCGCGKIVGIARLRLMGLR